MKEQKGAKEGKASGWWQRRTGYLDFIGRQRRVPVPAYAQGAAHMLGGLALACFLILTATGILLGLYYTPSVEHAHESVEYIESSVPFGGIVRGVHQWSASLMVVFVTLHMARTFYTGAYRPPRELTWILGVVLLFATLAAGFFGYALPWDQRGYWATQVGTNLIGEAARMPVVGALLAPIADAARLLLLGGTEVSQATLSRFYSLHVFAVPAIITLAVAGHFALVRRHKLSPPVWDPAARVPQEGEWDTNVRPFYPTHVALDAAAALMLIGAVVLLAANLAATTVFEPWSNRGALADLSAPADPYKTPQDIRPEWYYLWVFYLLKVMPPWLAFVIIPGVLTTALVALPFVAPRVPWTLPRSARLILLAAMAVTFVALTHLGGA